MSQPNFSGAATIPAEQLLRGELSGQECDRLTSVEPTQRRRFHWYLECWRRFDQFSGRAGRKEYWYFCLFNLWAIVVLALADQVLFDMFSEKGAFGPLSVIYYLASIVPGMAVTVRRLHDIGKSGWVLFIGGVPIVGPLTLLAFTTQASEATANTYGAIPD